MRRQGSAGLGMLLIVWLGGLPALQAQEAKTPPAAPPRLSLPVQTAVQQARLFMERGEYGSAVRLLEGSLSQADGDAVYLTLLAQAYQEYLKELQGQGRSDLVKMYHDRLQRIQGHLAPAASASSAVPPLPTIPQEPNQAPGVADSRSPIVIRGQKADEVPQPTALIAQANQAFSERQYPQAERFYQQASQQQTLPTLEKERWAYCKLHRVTELINQPPPSGLDWAGLEQEVRTAHAMAPRLTFSQKLLDIIHLQSKAAAKATTPASHPNLTRTASRTVNGWQVTESPNFRLHHQQEDLADQVLHAAEKARAAIARKWLGQGSFPNWTMKCDLYLYPDAASYSKATGAPAQSPGHSTIGADRQDARRLQNLRIDLRADHPHLVSCVLPHEVTHVTLAGQVAHLPIPRWADEGMAVLSETYERIARHIEPLAQAYQEQRIFTAEQLMNCDDYPDPSRMAAFYGQGVCLVQYLTEQKGPTEFVAFLRSAASKGYEAALRQHYGFGLSELDQHLQRYIVEERVPSLLLTGASATR